MKWLQDTPWKFEGSRYSVELVQDRPGVKVTLPDGKLFAELFLVSSAHTMQGRDVSAAIPQWQAEEIEGGYVLRGETDSLLWEKKTVSLTMLEDRMIYGMSVEGEGALTDVELLSGYYTGANKRHSNARFYSGFHVDSLFNPEPDGWEQYSVSHQERALIDMTGVPIPGRDHWFFTPPPFCFAVRKGDVCMTLGVTAQPGKHTFTEYEYIGGRGQGLILRYEGETKVSGTYELPQVQMIFGQDEYALLGEFSRIERIQPTAKRQFDWWTRPIFCGWGAQSALSQDYKKPAPALAFQKFYEDFTASLDEKGFNPGIIVIDDKWQAQYGLNNVDTEKWPDMKGFIRSMHEKGRKVLLWLKAWDPEGVDPALCVRDFKGNAQAIDPEHPEYLAIFKAACENMLSPEGLDADGFKIDFTARIPTCAGCQHYGQHWGLELMRDYLTMVHDTAKAIKEDALVMCHCPHPYLADKLDMIRLNDVNTGRPVCAQMIHRAKMTEAVLPDRLIDTDNWPMPNKQSWLDYERIQPDLGVPSLYYLWHMDNSPEEITEEDLDVVRDCWNRWEEKRKGMKLQLD